ncbi:MAG: 50S ribosomal protein L4 [Betaproteobacteria bacterium]|jgi:large subunit ribosomal protein L4
MQLELLNDQGQASSKFDAPETVFGRAYNEDLVHQIVVAYQANARQGTRAQKDREQVKHSTKKPFKQKGTGRARAGMTSSPIWRGGGRTFPNSPEENFTQKINKKMYRAGMASILSQLAREGRLAVVDTLTVEAPKTKLLAAKFKAMNLNSVLVISDQVDDNLYLASRNLPNVLVVEPRYADPLSLVHYKKVLVTKAAIDQLKEMFA